MADGKLALAAGYGHAIQPNEVDRKRIERTLSNRVRYRYVSPEVNPIAGGYLVRSPCCSRNIDRSGGMIDIAWLDYVAPHGSWLLYRRDHKRQEWIPFADFRKLSDALSALNEDPERIFWQ